MAFDVYDRAGNYDRTSALWTVKYDTLGPVMSIASSTHLSDALFYARTTLTATLTATDAGIGPQGIYWHLTTSDTCPGDITGIGTYVSGSLASITQSVPGTFEVYSLCAQGVDLLNIVGPVKRYAVNVDTRAPEISFQDPAPNSNINVNDLFIVRYNDKDGTLDLNEVTGVDVASILLKIDGVDIRATYGTACPPTGTACRLRVTATDIEWKPPTPWSTTNHAVELTLKDTTVDQNTRQENWSFTASAI